jgi:hypothetical protein
MREKEELEEPRSCDSEELGGVFGEESMVGICAQRWVS